MFIEIILLFTLVRAKVQPLAMTLSGAQVLQDFPRVLFEGFFGRPAATSICFKHVSDVS